MAVLEVILASAGLGTLLRSPPVLGFRWRRPVDRTVIKAGWGDPRPAIASRHYGVDIDGRPNDPIFAVLGGTVIRAQRRDETTAGRFVVIASDGPEGITRIRYLHLRHVMVTEGQRVGYGHLIGTMGCTGSCNVPHLHLDIFADDRLLAAYVKAFGRPRPRFPAERSGLGTQIPAEALLPADGYFERVPPLAKEHRIALRSSKSAMIVPRSST